MRRILTSMLPGVTMTWGNGTYALVPPEGCAWTADLAYNVFNDLLPALPQSMMAGLTAIPKLSSVFNDARLPPPPAVIVAKSDNLITPSRAAHGPAIVLYMPDNVKGASWLENKLNAAPFDCWVSCPAHVHVMTAPLALHGLLNTLFQ